MSHLTDAQLSHFRERLVEKRQQAEQQLALLKEEAKPVQLDKPIGRLSRMDEMQQQQMANHQLERVKVQLQQIEAALKRIETGDFGICARTGEPIPMERLEAMPEIPFGPVSDE